MEMMILAHGIPEELLYVFTAIYLLVPAALVSPGVLAHWRYGASLISIGLGLFLSGMLSWIGVSDAFGRGSAWRNELDWFDGMTVAFFAIFVTGCYGVWRWFRLPRR
jgi:hypothetical protein